MTNSPWGPAPVAPPSALPPARARVATLLGELGDAVPLAELAARLGGHPNATRAHLDALQADGLVEAAPLSAEGRGRPALGFTLTEEGRRTIGGDPTPRAYAELVSVLTAALATAPDAAERARAVGRSWGEARRDGAGSREQLVRALADLGFDPQIDGEVLHLRACPLLEAATVFPQVVCAIHAGLIEASAGSPDVRLEPFAEPGACRVRLST